MTRIDVGVAPSIPLRERRRMPWESPADQPRYARPALLGIAALAGTLFAWGINRGHYHTFYAAAVRSMACNWKAFFFGSFDPADSITLDKLPGFLWPQASDLRQDCTASGGPRPAGTSRLRRPGRAGRRRPAAHGSGRRGGA